MITLRYNIVTSDFDKIMNCELCPISIVSLYEGHFRSKETNSLLDSYKIWAIFNKIIPNSHKLI